LLSEVVTPPATPAIVAEMTTMSMNLFQNQFSSSSKFAEVFHEINPIKLWGEYGVDG